MSREQPRGSEGEGEEEEEGVCANNQVRRRRRCGEGWFQTGGNCVAAMQEWKGKGFKVRAGMEWDWFSFLERMPDGRAAGRTSEHTCEGWCEWGESDNEGRACSNSSKESEEQRNFGKEVE